MNSSEEKINFWMGVAIGAVFSAVITGLVIHDIVNDTWRAEAVKMGAAEWTATESGFAKFQWKTPKAESTIK